MIKMFTSCPECGKIVAARRNGKLKRHKIKVWDDKTMSGHLELCCGSNHRAKTAFAWKTYEEAEKAIGDQREQSMRALLRDIQPKEEEGDHGEKDRVIAQRPALLLPGRDF